MPEHPSNTQAPGAGLPAHAQAKTTWREYQKRLASGETSDLSIGLTATFTLDSVVPMVGTSLLQAGFKPRILLGEYDQVFQTCFDHRNQFGGAEPDVIALLWRIEEVLASEFIGFVMGRAKALEEARDKVDQLCRAVSHLRANFKGMLIISLPPFPQGTPVDLLDVDNPINAGLFHRTILTYAADRLGEVGQIRFIDCDALQRQFGAQSSFDVRKWYLYKQPYTESFLWQLGSLLGRLIKANRVAPRKCVVLDADNTLWGGVVGEEGVEGIAIGEDFPGSAYRDLQKYMLYLRSRGVLLAIASKNNEADVWEVFDAHDGMKLKREHISAWQINWQTKAGNIPLIAAELNIGTNSLVFVDDNPFEIEQIRKALPEVACIQVEEEPARILEALKRARLFDKFEVTGEDVKRADMLLSEQARTAVGEKLSAEEFAATLGLKVELSRARESQIGRIAQLVNKTNQFNLTTVRRTQDEVQALVASPGWRVCSLRVSDKFGEYGLVGVAILETGCERWRLDTLLMSCRVLGRSVETAFLAGLARVALAAGAVFCDAAFIPTAKNAPASKFLPGHGFRSLGGNDWEAELSAICSVPAFIDLVIDEGEPVRISFATS